MSERAKDFAAKVEVKFKNTQDYRIYIQFRRRMHRAGKDVGEWLAANAKRDMYGETETGLLSADHALDYLYAEFGIEFTRADLKFWRTKKARPKLRKSDYVEKPYGTKGTIQYFYKIHLLKKFVTNWLEIRRGRENKRIKKRLEEEAATIEAPVKKLIVEQKIIPMRTFRSEE